MRSLTKAEDLHLIRKRYVIDEREDCKIVINKKSLINFSSNDYLSLASHPAIKKAFIDGIQKYGVGSGSSADISGYYRSHQQLEESFAEFLNCDSAILFNSGYHANLGIFCALMNRHGNIYADKLCHASILDGIQLSRSKHIRYRHNDIEHLKSLMRNVKCNDLIITESVFSMDGDISPVDQIVKIAKQHQMMTIIDDAHGAGVLGKNGKGICEYYQLTQTDVSCFVVPLGKAFASTGAIVAGSRDVVEHLQQFSRTYRYTTALPPANSSATLAALHSVQKENWRRAKLSTLIDFFVEQAKLRSLNVITKHRTPIQCIFIGDNEDAINIQKKLMEHGYYIASIRPPTVPQKTARIRVSLNYAHIERDIEQLLDLIVKYMPRQYERI